MNTFKIVAVALALWRFGCSDSGNPTGTGNPQWVKELINQYQHAPVGNPPQSIWKYDFRGGEVYYVPPQCCDQYGLLHDSNGTIICYPDGGIGGGGDGRCQNFFQERKNEVLIWRDARTR